MQWWTRLTFPVQWWWFVNGGGGSQAWCHALTLYDLMHVSAPKIFVIFCLFLRQAQPIVCELATITFCFETGCELPNFTHVLAL